MVIKVCVGSSCHLRGSYDVIDAFKAVLKKHDMEDLVDLEASFCLGFCAEGVNAKMEELAVTSVQKLGENELFVHNLNADNVEEVFVNQIRPLIEL
ncbi:MAG: (2Fe-2S) ferredoxin domain-containing protein [Bacteroidales bacterium]|nr:(2Fe-2S) ferredoxin domain-containing protein [Bacteroidales bacterium]